MNQLTTTRFASFCGAFAAIVVLGGCAAESSEVGAEGSSFESSKTSALTAAAPGTCSSSLGSGLSGGYGRLDGTIFDVIPAGTHTCHGDSSHVHLQVDAGGSVYDVAVNVDSAEALVSAPLVGSAYSAGWHSGGGLDYVRDLGLHSAAFSQVSPDALAATFKVGAPIAVYMTGYSHSGGHLVHRSKGSPGHDGAVVLDAKGVKPTYVAFRFSSQQF